jgi:WD40 repeat protein
VLTSESFSPAYQVGGSLPPDSTTYVRRQADDELLQALLRHDFCYVFNSRQMGKSSLRVQTALRLQAAGVRCTTIDLTEIGTQHITIEQWYATIAAFLVKRFNLTIHLSSWWQAHQNLSPVNCLSEFFETILLVQVRDPIVIFIDEIDSVLGLSFSTDDFFALIRHCFNKRTENAAYHRLSFCLIGVTTPSDLISDRTRTPFNIGRAIELRGFRSTECTPLLPGLLHLRDPEATLKCILDWTGGQPFLTQKLCQLAKQSEIEDYNYPSQIWIDRLVQQRILQHWESQDEPDHLKTIRDRLLLREKWAGRFLGLYQRILESDGILTDDSLEQIEILLTGLVEKQQGKLQVKTRIYQAVFTLDWVNAQLGKLRPYAEAFNAWIATDQIDESRLLRGKALADAQDWSQGKQLSDLDYRFLAASEQCDRREVQQALEAAKAKEIQARLVQERRIVKLQRLLLGSLGILSAIAIGVSCFAIQQYREARQSEIRALASSSEGLFASNRQLDAMIDAIKAKRHLQELRTADGQTTAKVETALRQVVYGNNEFNRLIGHHGAVLSVAISPDGQYFATGSTDKTVKLWRRDGALLMTLKHSATVFRVAFSPQSDRIVSGSLDGSISLWHIDGTRLKTIQGHQAPVWGIAFSPDGKLLASSSADKTVKLWRVDGTLQATLTGHRKAVWSVAFSPDSQSVASAGVDTRVKLWSIQGKLLKTLQGHQAPVWGVSFCSKTNLLVSASSDRTAKLWRLDGTLVRTLKGENPMVGAACSGNGQFIATSGTDNLVSLWKPDGTLIRRLRQHNAVIRDVALSTDGLMAASASDDGTVKLWQRNQYLLKPMNGHQDIIWEIATSPNGKLIATVSADGTLKLWHADGMLITTVHGGESGFRSVSFSPDSRMLVTGDMNRTVQLWELGDLNHVSVRRVRSIAGHQASIYAVAISPDGKTIASAGDDKTIKLWTTEGQLQHSFVAHNERIWKLAFNSQGNLLASASEDGTAKLWSIKGRGIATLQEQSGVWGVAFNPQGTILVSASRNDTLRLWRTDGRLIRTIPGQSRGLTRVAFSPDGSTIATAGVDNTVKLWSQTGELLRTLPAHRGIVNSLEFSRDGNHLFSGGDDSMIVLWDLQKIRALNPLKYACDWIQDYLRSNAEVKDKDRSLCKF